MFTRRSISCSLHYVLGVHVSWQSKAQRSATLSSSEAEWVALSKAVKEDLKISFKLPAIIRVDVVGAIFMAGNATATSHTKHVDIKYKYVNEHVKDSNVKIVFMK